MERMMKSSSLVAATTISSVGAMTTSAMQSAHHYSDHVTRFTKPHALDLIDVIYNDIVKAKNILEIGCGTGVFGLAYLERFPRGIPGQTIYCTDINPAMVQVAERVVMTDPAPPQQQRMNECATQFIFQPADGTKLEMFEDHSFDIIVSVFGLFLIPDREAVLSQVRRVLSNGGGGILAMTAWTTTGDNEALRDAGFGANLHDAMSLMRLPKPTETTTTTAAPTAPTITKPQQILPQHILDWFEPSQVKEILTNNSMFQNVLVHRVIHSVSVPNVEAMWETFSCGGNPSSCHASDADVQQQQQREMMMANQKIILGDYIAMDGNVHRPLFIRTVSNIIVAQ
jgi:ubiquinone/menaquinone biosynthesis C-methylase UbiE